MHLLLAHADEYLPVLDAGLAPEAVGKAPEPEQLPHRAEVPLLERPEAAPDDLPAQRWGVVAPQGEEGESFLQALAPLLHHREKEQGAPVRCYRVPPDMDAAAAVSWRDQVHRAEDVPQEEWPKYLLLLGDLHQVSMEFQHVLTQSAFVGRLHFAQASGAADLAGYAAYADKVLASETHGEGAQVPEVLLYTAQDGTQATRLGHRLLVEPCQELMERRWKPRHPGLEIRLLPYDSSGAEGLVRAAGEARSGVLLTVTHGLGLPRRGWASVEEQRAVQGALGIARGKRLSGDMLRSTPFLPGGMWFCVACFGAATPPRSAFHAWLELLAQQRAYAGPEEVLKSLPRAGERPFLAALPQAVLANPAGPLAVVGHSDLAWAFGFMEPDMSYRSRASRIASALEVMVNGSRAGVALDALMRFYRDVNEGLMAYYQARQDARVREQHAPELRSLGYRWMLRNDLRGYILLGDPAVRLPLERDRA